MIGEDYETTNAEDFTKVCACVSARHKSSSIQEKFLVSFNCKSCTRFVHTLIVFSSLCLVAVATLGHDLKGFDDSIMYALLHGKI